MGLIWMQQEMTSIRVFVSFRHANFVNICIDRRVKWKCVFKQCADLDEERGRWRVLLMWQWTFGFHKMWGISWIAENQLASYEVLCAVEYIKLVRRYKFVNLDTYHREPLHLLHQRCEDLGLFFVDKRSPQGKFRETLVWHLFKWTIHYWLERISKYNIIRNKKQNYNS